MERGGALISGRQLIEEPCGAFRILVPEPYGCGGQAALDVRIVLHRMNVPRQRGDHGRRRPCRGDDPEPCGEFILRQTGLGRRRQRRNRLEPL